MLTPPSRRYLAVAVALAALAAAGCSKREPDAAKRADRASQPQAAEEGAKADKNAGAGQGANAAEGAAKDNGAAKRAQAPKQPERKVRGTGTLGDELAARAAASKGRVPQRFADLTADLFAKLRADKVTERALQVGAKAPDFVLPNAAGKDVALKALLARGPVVVTWYRGGWCPYCNIQMRYYSRMVPELDKLGATLVAINPETPDESLTVKERHHLPFEVLSDAGQRVARAYGLVFELTPGLGKVYEARFKMSERQGKKPGPDGKVASELPLAATYVIDRDGTIRWAFLDVDYKKRAQPADILEAVRKLRAPAQQDAPPVAGVP